MPDWIFGADCFTDSPLAPDDWNYANVEPFETFPISDWISAAADPFYIPESVKPTF